MKCIFDIGKNISIWAKVTQVSDVAHGPLVEIAPSSQATAEIYVLLLFHPWFNAIFSCP
jgi:hypothetical protein